MEKDPGQIGGESAQQNEGVEFDPQAEGVDWSEAQTVDALARALRDPRERFFFQGGSTYAERLAERLEGFAKRVKSLEVHLSIAESMYKVVVAERNLARAQSLMAREPMQLVGTVTTHKDGSVRYWGLGERPNLETATSLRNLYAPEAPVIGVVEFDATPPRSG